MRTRKSRIKTEYTFVFLFLFEINELLLKRQKLDSTSLKLETSWDGPYKIIKLLNDIVYWIQKDNSSRANVKVEHIELLAKCVRRAKEPIRDLRA